MFVIQRLYKIILSQLYRPRPSVSVLSLSAGKQNRCKITLFNGIASVVVNLSARKAKIGYVDDFSSHCRLITCCEMILNESALLLPVRSNRKQGFYQIISKQKS